MNEWCTAEEKYYFDTNLVSMQFLWWSEALIPLSRFPIGCDTPENTTLGIQWLKNACMYVNQSLDFSFSFWECFFHHDILSYTWRYHSSN